MADEIQVSGIEDEDGRQVLPVTLGAKMSKIPIDPTETYIVRELFGCGEGHCVGGTFTHWEQGEVCPMAHDPEANNEEVHLYWRKMLVYESSTREEGKVEIPDFWAYLTAPENENKYCQFPIAPEGLEVGQRIELASVQDRRSNADDLQGDAPYFCNCEKPGCKAQRSSTHETL